MDERHKQVRQVIMMALAGLLIGSLLFIFGISIQASIWPMVANYLIALILYICSFLAVYNNNKRDPQSLYKYIMVLTTLLIFLITIATVVNLLS